MNREQLLNLSKAELKFLNDASYRCEAFGADFGSLLVGGGSADTAADAAERMIDDYDMVDWEELMSLLNKIRRFNDYLPIGPRQEGPNAGPTLAVMQDGLRHPAKKMQEMYEFVRDGGIFYPTKQKIAIAKFGGPRLYVRDGIHRVVAIYLGRESQMLHPDEFQFEEYTYKKFEEINLDPKVWFVTPFDPRRHVRKADFFWFKQAVRDAIKNGSEAATFIRESATAYRVTRKVGHTIEDFANQVARMCELE